MTEKSFSYAPFILASILNIQLGGLEIGFLPESVFLLCFVIFCICGLKPLVKDFEIDVVIITVVIYLVSDISGMLLRWDASNFITKYRVVAVMALSAVMLAECRKNNGFTRKFFFFIAMSGIMLSFSVIINTFVLSFQPIEYIRRLSLRTDYNMFATALLASFICAMGYTLKSSRPYHSFLAFSCGILPVAVLACSRRVWLMLLFVIPMSAVIFIFRYGKKAALTLILSAAFTVTSVYVLSGAMTAAYEGGAALGKSEASGTASVAERFDTVKDAGMLTKRKVIWGIAIDELKEYSLKEKLIGRGAFYDISLYDEPNFDERLNTVYGDREDRLGTLSSHSCVLADMLNGGYLKLVALVVMLAEVGVRCVTETFKYPETGIFKLMLLAMTVSNSLISNRYGILYDRWFWLLIAVLTAGGGGEHEKTDSNGNGGSPG